MKSTLCLSLVLVTSAFAASPAPAPSPKAKLSELDMLIERLPAGEPADTFARLEDYVQAEDSPTPGLESVRRARTLVARFGEIVKALPPPPEKQDGELAQLLFTAGRALENGGAGPEARPVYERILKDYPKAIWEGGVTRETVSAQAQARLRFQAEKHPWMQKDLDGLMKALREAFAKHDKAALTGLIARIGFWSGPFASEGGADDPDRVLKVLDATWPTDKAVVAPEMEPFSEKDRQVFLKVSGFTGSFSEMYCILSKEADGWQWSGVAFADKPGAEPSVPEPDASATPAPAASASAKPKAQ